MPIILDSAGISTRYRAGRGEYGILPTTSNNYATSLNSDIPTPATESERTAEDVSIDSTSAGFNWRWLLAGYSAGLVLAALVSLLLSQAEVSDQQLEFGEASAQQLAILAVQPILEEDLISLNVLVSDLVEQKHYQFASIYSTDNQLLAQAGQPAGALFSRDISFQANVLGRAQVGIPDRSQTLWRSITASTVLLWLASIGLLFAARNLNWKLPEIPAMNRPVAIKADEVVDEPGSGDSVIVLIRILPGRLAPECQPVIDAAAGLYQGNKIVVKDDEITLTFNGSDIGLRAICCALLIFQVLIRESSPVSIKAGIHLEQDDPLQATKQARYLANLSENLLLTSKALFEFLPDQDRYLSEPFHHAAVHEGDVQVIRRISDQQQQLINRQAEQLSGLI